MTLPVWVFCIGIDSPQRGSLYVLWTINIFIMCAMIDYTFIMCSLFIYHTVSTQETHENSFRSGYIYRHFIIVFVSVYLQMTGKMTQVCLFEMPCHITSIDMASLPCESRHDLKDYSSIRNSCHNICIGMTSFQYANLCIYIYKALSQ